MIVVVMLVCVGGGAGAGAPTECASPAKTEPESTHVSAIANANRFIGLFSFEC
jgi:hypothetical protein